MYRILPFLDLDVRLGFRVPGLRLYVNERTYDCVTRRREWTYTGDGFFRVLRMPLRKHGTTMYVDVLHFPEVWTESDIALAQGVERDPEVPGGAMFGPLRFGGRSTASVMVHLWPLAVVQHYIRLVRT